MALLIFYLLFALVTSFICSLVEAVLLSTSISHLRIEEKNGNKNARSLLNLKQNIDKPLSAILSLNTIAHTIGAAGVGAEVTKIFGDVYFGIASVILTLLILIFTEIIPKTIGALYWKKLTTTTLLIINSMIFITYPIVISLLFFSKLLSKGKKELTTSREEIFTLANIGAEEGIFDEKENKIIQNLFKLKSIKATEVMTPRVVVSVSDENLLLKDFFKNKNNLKFSRIPVYSNSVENITGYVFRQEVFEKLAEGMDEMKLSDIKREIVFVPESIQLFDVWEILLEMKEHIALIIDDYGGMQGIITMEDIIETLLGFEILDEKDTITDMQHYARERWKMRQTKYNLFEDLNYLKNKQ